MKSQAQEQRAIRQYLLGQLPPTELQDLEQKLLTDSAFYEELLIEEDELIDQYLSETLSSSERESFEIHFALPAERRSKLRFAGALRKYVADRNTTESIGAEELPRITSRGAFPGKRFLFSFLPIRNPVSALSLAVVVLLVVGGAWLMIRYYTQARPPESFFAVELMPGVTRSGGEGIRTFAIPAGVEVVRLQLLLTEDSYQSFASTLQDVDGKVLLTQYNLESESINGHAVVILDVPSSVLKRSEYQVKLSGTASDGNSVAVGRYSFRVVASI